MSIPITTHWSTQLQQQTLEAIEQVSIAPDGCIHFKHQMLGFAFVAVNDLLQGQLKLISKIDAKAYSLLDATDLLNAGWAIA